MPRRAVNLKSKNIAPKADLKTASKSGRAATPSGFTPPENSLEESGANPSTLFSPPHQIISLIIITMLAYLPCLRGPFLWDDVNSLSNNPLLADATGLRLIWTSLHQIPQEVHWWPFTYTIFWLEHHLWGWNTLGYHLVNVLLHAAVCVQLWHLLRHERMRGAWTAAALFALHPVHVEAVAWVVELKDLLATLCSLFAAGCFLRFRAQRGHPATGWLLAAMAMAALAMLGKSTPVALAPLLAIWIFYRYGRIDRRSTLGLAGLLGVTLGFALVDLAVVHRSSPVNPFPPTMAYRLARAGGAVWVYLGKLLWPANLAPLYNRWKITPDFLGWLPFLLIAPSLLAAWLLRRRLGRGIFCGWLAYLLTLAPMLGIIDMSVLSTTPVSDRYQYLASLGPIIGIGVWVGSIPGPNTFLGRIPSALLIRRVVTALVLALLGVLTWRHAGIYADDVKFWEYTVRVSPKAGRGFTNLGSAYFVRKRLPEARAAYTQALQLNPRDPDALGYLGEVQMQLGNTAEGLAVLQRATEAEPAPNRFVLLARALATAPQEYRDSPRALQILVPLIAANPNNAFCLDVYATALADNNRWQEATAAEARAIQLMPAQGIAGQLPQAQANLQKYTAAAHGEAH